MLGEKSKGAKERKIKLKSIDIYDENMTPLD